jgi:DeoR/GlpR family transcriptional regulator of sugar metabolism
MTREDVARARHLVWRLASTLATIRQDLAELEHLMIAADAQLDAEPASPRPRN